MFNCLYHFFNERMEMQLDSSIIAQNKTKTQQDSSLKLIELWKIRNLNVHMRVYNRVSTQ